MAYILRFRKLCFLEPLNYSSCDQSKINEKKSIKTPKVEIENQGAVFAVLEENPKRKKWKKQPKEWRLPESPGERLKREGLTALHPVVLVLGVVTGGLELWEGKPYYDGLFRSFRILIKILTPNEHFDEILGLWLEHLSLDGETGLDPPEIRVRTIPGLVAVDYFALGYFVWAILIGNLAHISYEGKNMYMLAYDWRLSFQNTEV
ncbi:phospholipid:diacylglycerol acyltransferase 2 [Olea europaea subsp. europaea]|uniref:Phospholipid:diacylglycerol acyltransferase 2 n=1 Tax=Olea europaea subsp. europaea TaxID=158383 RepID=A0A8S0PGK4_OLEEU|nr:phospholipid:diacylglycerol acyltransferase 2 [Olea europaea subsp. europaea]